MTRVNYSIGMRCTYFNRSLADWMPAMSSIRFDQYLTEDHRSCDSLLGTLRTAAKAGDWSGANQAFEAFRHDVLAHFSAEEAVLFPAFEIRTGMSGGPTRVMRMEHDEARLLIEDLAEAVATSDADGVRGHAETLLILLQQHNLKEENILYPAAADVAGKDLRALSAEVIAHREAA